MQKTISRLVMVAVVALSLAACSGQDEPVLGAQEAFAKAQSGEVTLIDIRRPDEWKQTGLAKDALAINMQHPQGTSGFIRAVSDAVNQSPDAPIVLICRTGSRSSRMVQVLKDSGFSNVRHVSEGMLGSSSGQGWIARGLPVEPCQHC